jgi:hypothetical protein
METEIEWSEFFPDGSITTENSTLRMRKFLIRIEHPYLIFTRDYDVLLHQVPSTSRVSKEGDYFSMRFTPRDGSDFIGGIYFPIKLSSFRITCNYKVIVESSTAQNEEGYIILDTIMPYKWYGWHNVCIEWKVCPTESLIELYNTIPDEFRPTIICGWFTQEYNNKYSLELKNLSPLTISLVQDPAAKFNVCMDIDQNDSLNRWCRLLPYSRST